MIPSGFYRYIPPVFNWLQTEGAISNEEMLRTFNCGLGMIAIVSPENVQAVVDETEKEARVVGKVLAIKEGSPQVNVRCVSRRVAMCVDLHWSEDTTSFESSLCRHVFPLILFHWAVLQC